MAKIKLTPEQKAAREKKVIEMYAKGMPQQIICSELRISCAEIRKITRAAGVYIKGRAGILNRKTPEGYKRPTRISDYRESSETIETEEKLKESIRAEDIEKARRMIKVGSFMNIRTCKAVTISKSCVNINGYIRRAVVVNTDSRQFCRVRIEANGAEEYIKWQDIVVAMRNNRPYVG